MKYILAITAILVLVCKTSCTKEQDNHKTETLPKVVIIVMDGARYTETWGDLTHKYIPFLADSIAPLSSIYTNFNNIGVTSTLPGHTALTTGNYENITNNGTVLPTNPSIFQHFEKKYNEKGWIISSKDKLSVLSNCLNTEWHNQYNPFFDCGKEGLGEGYGYRHDSVTYKKALWILDVFQPRLCLISFKEPDSSGHSGNWESYIQALRTTDSLVYMLFDKLRTNPFYKNQTTVFITNDHGRHLDGIKDGFKSHGDTCSGCRHCMLFIYGSQIKKGIQLDTLRSFIDVPATIAYLLNFTLPDRQGEIMEEILFRR